jgi:hypothetical protein
MIQDKRAVRRKPRSLKVTARQEIIDRGVVDCRKLLGKREAK